MPKKNQPTAEERAAKKADTEKRKQQRAKELKAQRIKQQAAATEAFQKAQTFMHSIDKKIETRDALASHLEGFYEEIDKLAKGRGLLEATHLIVQQINDIVRDAKSIIDGDPHLDRVKEFVPAGNNPVYPDVLVVARTVQQCLGRFEDVFSAKREELDDISKQAATIVAAMELIIGNEHWPSKAAVREVIDGPASDQWFVRSDDGVEYFNLSLLDRTDIAERLRAD